MNQIKEKLLNKIKADAIQLTDLIYAYYKKPVNTSIEIKKPYNPFTKSYSWKNGKGSPASIEELSNYLNGTIDNGWGLHCTSQNNIVVIDNDFEDQHTQSIVDNAIIKILGIEKVPHIFSKSETRSKIVFLLTDKKTRNYKTKNITRTCWDNFWGNGNHTDDNGQPVDYRPDIEVFYNASKYVKLYGWHSTLAYKTESNTESIEFYQFSNDWDFIECSDDQFDAIIEEIAKTEGYAFKQDKKQPKIEKKKKATNSLNDVYNDICNLKAGERDSSLMEGTDPLIFQFIRACDKSKEPTPELLLNKALREIFGNEDISKYVEYYKEKSQEYQQKKDKKKQKPRDANQFIYDAEKEENINTLIEYIQKHVGYDSFLDVVLWNGIPDSELATREIYRATSSATGITKTDRESCLDLVCSDNAYMFDSLQRFFFNILQPAKMAINYNSKYLWDIITTREQQIIDGIDKQICTTIGIDILLDNGRTYHAKSPTELFLKYMCLSITRLALNLYNEENIPCIYPVLIGAKGIGKSSLTRALCLGKLSYWSDSISLSKDNAEIYRQMKGHLICEIGELQGIRKKDFADLKALLRTSKFQYRKMHTEVMHIGTRRTYFMLTTNESNYLKETDERCLFDVEITGIDRAKLTPELIAQSYVKSYLATDGSAITDKDFIDIQNVVQEYAIQSHNEHDSDFETMDMIENYIEDKLETNKIEILHNINGQAYIAMTIQNIIENENITNNQQNQKQIGSALKKLGFERKKVRLTNKSPQWCFIIPYDVWLEKNDFN